MNIRYAFAALAAATLVSAAVPASAKAPAHHTTRPASHLVTIQVDTDFRPHKRSTFGAIKGYNPPEVHVHMGDKIQFVNTDDAVHTATGMSYTGQTVPASYKFAGDFTKAHGNIIDASEWSTGVLRPHGGKSQVFIAKRVGHYFYGCGYHLGQGQIGVIVVGP